MSFRGDATPWTCCITVFWRPRLLDLDAAAELDHAVRGNVEEVDDAAGVARHGGEEPVAPQHHGRSPGDRDDLLARQEERGLHHLDLEPGAGALLERPGEVRPLQETVAHAHPPAAAAELLAGD